MTETQTHELKTWPEFFEEVRLGNKPFEYRLNDRDYKVNDVLHLREWVPPPQELIEEAGASAIGFSNHYNGYTGRDLWKRVSYVLPATAAGPQGKYAHQGFVIMGLAPFHVGADVNPHPWVPMTDPTDIKVIGKAVEEFGEAISAMARCLIQGIDETQPSTGKINREWLEDELADTSATAGHLYERFGLNRQRMTDRSKVKFNHLAKWFAQLSA